MLQTPKPNTATRQECLIMPPDGRGLIVGKTGEGKSVLAGVLIEDKLNLIIIDPKRRFVPRQEYILTTSIDELPDAAGKAEREGKAVLLRPSIDALESIEEIDRVFRWIFERGNTFTYLDEVTTIITNPQRYPKYLRAIYTQGRELGCGILCATQRPSGIPGFIMSEAERYWKFLLTQRVDQERMAQFMGDIVLDPSPEESVHAKYSFFFSEQGSRKPAELFILSDKGGQR